MSDAQFRPQGMTRLVPGRYTLLCTGPAGVILNLTVDLAHRTTFECLLDDDRMQELLVINSVAGGVIEGELHKAQRGGAA